MAKYEVYIDDNKLVGGELVGRVRTFDWLERLGKRVRVVYGEGRLCLTEVTVFASSSPGGK